MNLIYPTKEEFNTYCGENISNKLSGDLKEPEAQLNALFKRCERVILMNLPGIKLEELEEKDIENWKDILCEQAEYFLSVGDASLQGNGSGLSPNIEAMARQSELWSPWL